MRPLLAAYVLGIATVLVLALLLGGETVTQLGLRLTAATTHYDFEAIAQAAPLASGTPIDMRHRGRR